MKVDLDEDESKTLVLNRHHKLNPRSAHSTFSINTAGTNFCTFLTKSRVPATPQGTK